MIGIRAALSGTLAAALCAGAVQAGGSGPGAALAADALVADRAARADAALAEVELALEPVLAAARRGAARIVAGDEQPGDELRAAADAARAAEPAMGRAASALERLAGARLVLDARAATVEAPVATGEMGSIAAQLEATAEAGDAFATMRRRADAVTRELATALEALDDGDLDAAQAAVEAARREHRHIAEWEVDLVTLPLWLDTTDAMIGAMEAIVAATRAGDAAAARVAAMSFAAVEEEADTADRALRIAVSEGGSSVAAPALGRLVDVLAAVRQARMEVAVILQAADR
jgi:hypothetical protein